jgi:cysteine desulfurase
MQDASASLFANPHAADHALGWNAYIAIQRAAERVGNLFGLQGDDVVFTSGASEANAMVLHAARLISQQTDQNEVLVGAADHGSIMNEAVSSGLAVRHIGLDGSGAPDPKVLKKVLTDKTALVTVIGVNNENGAITDLKAVADVCKTTGTMLHVDLSQSALASDIDLFDLEIGLATVSGHKLYGPKGVGALLINHGIAQFESPLIVGAGQQGGRRGGTMPTELICGFGEACKLVEELKETDRNRVATIRDGFIDLLEQNQIATLIGGRENRHPGNALMRFPGCNASDLLARVQPEIAASTQSACSSGSIEPSHVLQAMGLDSKSASECVRFSFGRFSTESQAKAAFEILLNVVVDLRESALE